MADYEVCVYYWAVHLKGNMDANVFLLEKLRKEKFSQNINLLLTEREGRTGDYWPEVVAIRSVCTKTTELGL